MKLSKLIIKNFRGLKGDQNIIEFSNSNIIFLIGQNNIGKSTFLRAYEYLTNPKQKVLIDDFYNSNLQEPITIEGWFVLEKGDKEDKELNSKNKEPDWIEKWVDNNNGYIKIQKQWSSPESSFIKRTFSPLENDWIIGGFGGMDTLFTSHAPTAIAINAMENENSLEEKVNKLILDGFIKKMNENHSELCGEIKEMIKELQKRITSSKEIESYNDDLNRVFKSTFSDLTLKIEASKDENIKIEDAFKKNHTVIVEKAGNGNERKETILQNGHGVIRQALFNFLTSLQENNTGDKKEYIILFEEPELFLHPKAAFLLRESLYELANNSPYQIICATHSPLMIDISRPHSSLIRITKDKEGTTLTYQVGEDVFGSDEEQKQRVQMINRFNPHVCEAFYANKVLLVEGDTETIVYRDLLKRFYETEEIFVLNTGSKNNIPFFQDILTKFNIEHYVIHDTDTKAAERNGNIIANPAWTLNEMIWKKIEEANNLREGMARRYVHVTNFEIAHNIQIRNNKNKPLEAFLFVSNIQSVNDNADCLLWLNDIIKDKQIIHDINYVELALENFNEKNKQKALKSIDNMMKK